jgi:phosphoribosylaminoimidazole-succinocarboxamide synthase
VTTPSRVAGLRHLHSGKVRDLYETGDGELLMVASDRMSAYDHVLPTPIPDKGRILTQLSLWWFERLADVVPNHVLSTEVPAEVAGRAVVCRRLEMFPVECVARGYLAGSGVTDYAATGEVCGNPLPPGLVMGSELPEPIFTPATKAPMGEHDENVSYDAVVGTVGEEWAAELRALTLAVYGKARDIALERGIVLADTKFEFGRTPDGQILLADEVLTPDSSRFWRADQWQPGSPPPSYDKQFVRDWLTSPASGWDRHSGEKPPPLPDDVVEATRARYVEAYERLTGRSFA